MSFIVSANTIVNDDPSGRLLLDPTTIQPTFSGNDVWGLPAGAGLALLSARPTLDTSAVQFSYPGTTVTPPPPPPPPTQHGHNGHGHGHLAAALQDFFGGHP
jgi:hypothetical protein